MALTITDITEGATGWPAATNAQFVTGSISPGTNCLLVLLFGIIPNSTDPWSGSAPTCTSSGSGPSWTPIGEGGAPGSTFVPNTAGFYATIGGTDPGSFTVTVTWSNIDETTAVAYTVFKATGHDTSTPLGGFVFTRNQAGNGANTITLSAAPATDDVTLALSIADENSGAHGATFGTGTWTETFDGGSGSQTLAYNAGYRTGSTSTSVPWSDVNTGSDNFGSAQCAVVVKVASGTDGTATPATIATTVAIPQATAFTGTATPATIGVTSTVPQASATGSPSAVVALNPVRSGLRLA